MAERYDLPKPGECKVESNAIDIPGISIPKGGGAMKGIDEKFDVNPTNGSVSLCISLPVAGGRGFSPNLSLSYSTGSGNGPFGLGWSLSISDISRKTDKGLPKYLDNVESDVFILSGSEDLVPAFKTDSDGHHIPDASHHGHYLLDEKDSPGIFGITGNISIKRYIPRIEGDFAKIEKITSMDGIIRWRVISASNTVTLFGWTENARLSDPSDSSRIFKWLPEYSYDNLGNCVQYIYKKDMYCNAVQLYPAKVLYCNKKAWYPGTSFPIPEDYLFSTVFDYGEWDIEKDCEKPVAEWSTRNDVFTSRRSCFEIRTARLCRNVLLFSHMDKVPGGRALLSVTELGYDESDSISLLVSSGNISYRKHDDGTYSKKVLPPMVFSYSSHEWNAEVKCADGIAVDERCTFCDLYNEGVPGILYNEPAVGLMFRSNLGSGHFDIARQVSPAPSNKRLSIVSLDTDGRMQLADLTPSEGGFYEIENPSGLENGNHGCISPFKPFELLPNVSTNDSNIRLIDLNGDGKAEMVVSSDSIYLWYPSQGKTGFSAAESFPMSIDGEDGPNIVFSDAEGTVFLADMTGDGLVDIVRINRTEVYYYPNLGYGKFGKKVIMENSPVLASPDEFTPSMVRLADIDGTGTADLVYLAEGSFKCFLNQCGRKYAVEPFTITSIPWTDRMTDVQMCDILGSGTSCIVWTSYAPQEQGRQIRYIDLMSSKKPYLLEKYSNSLGKEVKLTYTSSTVFYLDDKQNGEPWLSRIGFPVYCLTKVETLDRISGWRFISSYRYRDGFFDPLEREFRGFGIVQTTDTEAFEHWAVESSNIIDRTVHQEPVVTKTWTNLGNGRQSKEDSLFLHLGDDLIENCSSMTDLELQEASRALKGQIYRNEVYRPDQDSPCSVFIASSRVRLLQPMGQNSHAVFMATSYQNFERAFEDDSEDPRVSQSIDLSIDRYGNILESIGIIYPRNKADASAPASVRKEQAKTLITYNRSIYTDDVINDDIYFLRSCACTSAYELSGFRPSFGMWFTPMDFSSAQLAPSVTIRNDDESGIPIKRLLSGSQSLFFDNDLRSPLPLGKLAFPAITYGNYQLAFTESILADIYGDKVNADLLEEAKYVRLDNILPNEDEECCWWIPSGNVWFLDDGETSDAAKGRFYAPLRYSDRFGTQTKVRYDSDCYLFVSKVENAYGESESIEDIDFITLNPTLIKDINGNYTSAVYDETGAVKATAVLGKGDEADSLENIISQTSENEQEMIRRFFNETDSDKLTTIAKQLLGSATSRFVYDYDCYAKYSIPARTATIIRERHYKDDHDSPVQISFEYSNGCGSIILSKAQAEPDAASPYSGIRWIGSGRTVINNKGNTVMQYEPYFSQTPAFESDKEIVETGVTPILHYDALGRNIRTDYPDGTFDKVKIHSWSVNVFSTGDTVKDSRWYSERMSLEVDSEEHKAAIKSEVYHNTPVTAYLSVSGAALCLTDYGLSSSVETDILGNLLSVTDPRGIKVQSFKYDHLGRPLFSEGADNGRRWTLEDADGHPVRSWDDRGHMIEYHYDLIRRPVYGRVSTIDMQEGETRLDNVFARWRYGEDLLQDFSLEIIQKRNALGRAVTVWDTGGTINSEYYDFNGNPITIERRLTKSFNGTVNWTEGHLDDNLDNEIFKVSTKYDALGRIMEQTTPDGSIIMLEYNAGGLLSGESAILSGSSRCRSYIDEIVYNEKRQRCHIKFGNGVTTRNTFNKETFRLEETVSTRKNGSIIQNFMYTFDAIGNISHISDRSGHKYFHNNKSVSGDSDYSYDCLGRLASATGRENAAAIGRNGFDNFDDKDFIRALSDMDSMAVRTYSEQYDYDPSGNILSMHHSSEGNTWTRNFQYSDDENRLLITSTGDYSYFYKHHNRHGFITAMPHLSYIRWNFMDQMESSSRQVRTDGGNPETTYYQYDGSGKRIRKITITSSESGKNGIVKDERIYIGGFELFRKYSGADKGLERTTLNLMDGETRFLMIERRNDVDDGSEKCLERYLTINHIGSNTLELDEVGRIISCEEFTPYGSTAFQANDMAIRTAAKRYRFTGMERDEETGLSYHSARYYIPWLGRWLSSDPIGIAGGLNLYCYCGNDPVNRNDTDGTDWKKNALNILQVVAGAAEGVAAVALTGVAAGAGATGIGAPVAAIAASGAVFLGSRAVDDIYTGGKNLIMGTSDDTLLADAIEYYGEKGGMERKEADALGKKMDLYVSAGSMLVPGGGILKLPGTAARIEKASYTTYQVASKGTRMATAKEMELAKVATVAETTRPAVSSGTRMATPAELKLARVAIDVNASREVATNGTRMATAAEMELARVAVDVNLTRKAVSGGTRMATPAELELAKVARVAEAARPAVSSGTRMATPAELRLARVAIDVNASRRAISGGTRMATPAELKMAQLARTVDLTGQTTTVVAPVSKISPNAYSSHKIYNFANKASSSLILSRASNVGSSILLYQSGKSVYQQ